MKKVVIVEYAPVSERYWNKGDQATIFNGHIRLGGCWFEFGEDYVVAEVREELPDKVVVYHGTCASLLDSIKRNGLLPKQGNKHVYLTTDRNAAINYARAWTAWAIENMDEVRRFSKHQVKPEGVIIKTVLDESFLTPDPYNPEEERDQYRALGAVYMDDAEFEVISFADEFADETNRLRAYSFWMGIGRATE